MQAKVKEETLQRRLPRLPPPELPRGALPPPLLRGAGALWRGAL
jgi:hypothetical protein